MVESFTVSTFAPHLGDTFRIYSDSGSSLQVELIEATELGQGSGHGPGSPPGRTPFSIVFRGPPEGFLPQRIYRIEHDGIGSFDLFLVPIGPDGEGMRYEAVFT